MAENTGGGGEKSRTAHRPSSRGALSLLLSPIQIAQPRGGEDDRWNSESNRKGKVPEARGTRENNGRKGGKKKDPLPRATTARNVVTESASAPLSIRSTWRLKERGERK